MSGLPAVTRYRSRCSAAFGVASVGTAGLLRRGAGARRNVRRRVALPGALDAAEVEVVVDGARGEREAGMIRSAVRCRAFSTRTSGAPVALRRTGAGQSRALIGTLSTGWPSSSRGTSPARMLTCSEGRISCGIASCASRAVRSATKSCLDVPPPT